jgi:hypothetical protein
MGKKISKKKTQCLPLLAYKTWALSHLMKASNMKNSRRSILNKLNIERKNKKQSITQNDPKEQISY